MSAARVLVVHPEGAPYELLVSMLQSMGHTVEEAQNDRVAARWLDRQAADLVMVGANAGRAEALELLAYARRKHARMPILMVFDAPEPGREREAVRQGATEVLRYPLAAHDLRAAVTQALESAPRPLVGQGMRPSLAATKPAEPTPRPTPARSEPPAPAMLGEDSALRQALELARAMATSRCAVLIGGERGTGKHALARWIHQLGPRRDAPLGEATGSSQALERELFGDVLRPERVPRLAAASGGTLVLAQAELVPAHAQARLLRFLDEGTIDVPTARTAVDVRLIFTTRTDPAIAATRGEVRADYWERIGVVTLKLPPLRARPADIERLAEQALQRAAREANKGLVGFTPEAMDALLRYPWPGNVAELEGAIRRAAHQTRGARISSAALELPNIVGNGRANPGGDGLAVGSTIRPLKEALEEPEKQIIRQALESLNWNRQETARVLDINRTTLYKKMKKYGLLRERREPSWPAAG